MLGDLKDSNLRVLILAPFGKDARLICDVLSKGEIESQACATPDELRREWQAGAGAIVIAEEALTPAFVSLFAKLIEDQPSWSDFPLIVLTSAGQVSLRSEKRREMRDPLGNVLLLERPLRPETLVSSIQSALRARRRQYQIRDQMRQWVVAQEALRRSEKLAVAGRLAASIAHEINNPLTSVINLVYLMKKSYSMEELKTYLAQAEPELARVSEITVQTLKFYRQNSRPTLVRVNEVVQSALSLYGPRLLSAEVRVQTRFDETPPIKGFGGELRQVFANLVGNALDAMRTGGRLLVHVRQSKDRSNGSRPGVRVVIADTGTGIPGEIRGTLFEPFVSTKGTTGTGLGLWVSAEIIRKHDGTIRVKSRTGTPKSGTTFSVFLPAA